jgi:transcriptional regulator with XRE-family HTH domain
MIGHCSSGCFRVNAMGKRARLIDTDANRQAGLALRRLRDTLGSRPRNRLKPLTQDEFRKFLANLLGVSDLSQSQVSNWEGAEVTVPAAALIAVAKEVSKHLGRPATIDEVLEGINRSCFPIAA